MHSSTRRKGSIDFPMQFRKIDGQRAVILRAGLLLNASPT